MTIATTEPQAPEMGAFDERDDKVLAYLGLNPNSPADRAAVMVCRAYDLDAVLKHVVVIPRGGVYITRDGLLHIAHRSGQLDGIVVDQEPVLVGDEWVAKVSVYRKDMSHPFTFPGRYPVNGSNKQYAPEMALKAAEAHALRRAFAVAGLPTFDEQRPDVHRVDVDQSAPAADRMAAMLDPQNSGPEASQAVVASDSVAPQGDVGRPGPESPVDAEVVEEPSMLTDGQRRNIGRLMGSSGLDITDRAEALGYVSSKIGRTIGSRNELTRPEAVTLINALEADVALLAAPEQAPKDES